MPKNLFQDMVKVKRMNRQVEEVPERIDRPYNSSFKKNLEINASYDVFGVQGNNRTRYMLWGVAGISLLFLFFALSYMFSSAVVTVTPKTKDIVLNKNLSAIKDGGTETLPFDLVVVSGEENKTVQTTGQKDVSQSAKGVAVIYNAFSTATQRLTIDTRLLGSNGKIYKTEKAIVVPGMQGNIPGSIEVNVYGVAPGEAYNSVPLDFSIVGFQGTPKYSKFYGRSKGLITGGIVGKINVISDADKTSALTELSSALKAKLLANTINQTPTGFVLFKNAVFLSTEDPIIPLTTDQNNNVTIKQKGTLYGFLFNEEKLTAQIAQDNIDQYDGAPVYLPNIRDLNFSLISPSPTDNISFRNAQNINFNLSGTTKIVWKIDENKLIVNLMGQSKKDFGPILLQYLNIDSANLSLSPFWRMSLPDKSKEIKIITNYPK